VRNSAAAYVSSGHRGGKQARSLLLEPQLESPARGSRQDEYNGVFKAKLDRRTESLTGATSGCNNQYTSALIV